MSQSGPGNTRATDPPRSENPRRVRHGIKLRSKEGPKPENWIVERWLKLMETTFEAETLAEGLAYARSGQTAALDVQRGLITARVQGRLPRAYVLEMRIEPISPEQWEAVVKEMAGGAIYAARLLAGELPPNLADLFHTLELSFVANESHHVATSCTCSEDKPCKHLAAVWYVLAERLNSDPLEMFTVYGMPADRLLEQLRQARAMHTHGVAAAHPDPMIPESQIEPPPLEACIDEFWRSGPQLAELEHSPPPQHIAHALLRRLGPSPMRGRFPLVGLLASIYDTVAQEAIHIRDQAEHIEPADEDSSDS